MAIVKETVVRGNIQYDYTYSDRGLMIHGGSPEADYSEAYDPVNSGRGYTETDIPVVADLVELLNVLVGVEE